MKILLSPETERLITAKVSSGKYQSADELVREGLELLLERERSMALNTTSHTSTDLLAAFENIANTLPGDELDKVRDLADTS
jgi:putative addiction module CopG family antidote